MIDLRTKTFFTALQQELTEKILVVGIGNTLKADDGIGPQICSLLKTSISDNIIDAGTVPENYIQVITRKNPEIILFIDAIDFDASAGKIRIFDPDDLSTAGLSTHTFSPRLLTDIIDQKIKAKIYFIGIQPKTTQIGKPMSWEVKSAKEDLLKQFKRLFFTTTVQPNTPISPRTENTSDC